MPGDRHEHVAPVRGAWPQAVALGDEQRGRVRQTALGFAPSSDGVKHTRLTRLKSVPCLPDLPYFFAAKPSFLWIVLPVSVRSSHTLDRIGHSLRT